MGQSSTALFISHEHAEMERVTDVPARVSNDALETRRRPCGVDERSAIRAALTSTDIDAPC